MRWYDRLALILLGGLLVWLVASLFFLGNHVADLDDRPQRIDIRDVPESPPTTPPTFNLDGTRVRDDGSCA